MAPTRENRNARSLEAGLVVGLVATALTVQSVRALDAPISANVASLFVGQQKVVEGKVLGAERDGNTVRLRFGNGPRDFVAALAIPLLSNFPPDPEHAYVGKTVRVVGMITDFRGTPEVVVHDVTDIQVVGESPPAVVATGSGARESPPEENAELHHQIETLNERIRVMDERLRTLEGGAPQADPPANGSPE